MANVLKSQCQISIVGTALKYYKVPIFEEKTAIIKLLRENLCDGEQVYTDLLEVCTKDPTNDYWVWFC